MSQKSDNAAYQQTVNSRIGQITLLVPPKQGVGGLKRPYEFRISEESISELVTALKGIMSEISPFMQYATAAAAPLKYGVKLNVWVLGYCVGFTGNPKTGVTTAEWRIVSRAIRDVICTHLGPQVKVYIEPWSSERKFEIRFQAYIQRA